LFVDYGDTTIQQVSGLGRVGKQRHVLPGWLRGERYFVITSVFKFDMFSYCISKFSDNCLSLLNIRIHVVNNHSLI